MTPPAWEAAGGAALAMVLAAGDGGRLAVLFNRSGQAMTFRLPPRPGHAWERSPDGRVEVGGRSVVFVAEAPGEGSGARPLRQAPRRPKPRRV
jgi:hypothetical protein